MHPGTQLGLLANLCGLHDVEVSCISTKGKGNRHAQKDGRCLLLLVPVAEDRLDMTAVTAQHMQGSSPRSLLFPRLSGAVATASPSPALPSSVSLAFPSTPGLVLALPSWETKINFKHAATWLRPLHLTSSPEHDVPPSALWWHSVPRCQHHTCGSEMDGNLQNLHKSHNKYSSSNTKSSCMLYLPDWFEHRLNYAVLSWLLGGHILGRVERLIT